MHSANAFVNFEQDEKSVVQNTTNELHSSAHLWTKLHFCILQTILQFPTIPGAPQLELITLADMTAIVKDVSVLVQRLQSCQATEVAVDRLVQVLQVALATGAFRCSIGINTCISLDFCIYDFV